jgi:hypothetical protein
MPSLTEVFKNNSDAIRQKLKSTELIAPVNQATRITEIEAQTGIKPEYINIITIEESEVKN